jgi:hypothetical protein
MKRAVTKSLEADKLHHAMARPVNTNPTIPLQQWRMLRHTHRKNYSVTILFVNPWKFKQLLAKEV